MRIPAHQQIILYTSSQWEDLIHEWAHYCLKSNMCKCNVLAELEIMELILLASKVTKNCKEHGTITSANITTMLCILVMHCRKLGKFFGIVSKKSIRRRENIILLLPKVLERH